MTERIIQFGEGNFLRGFADYFIHKLNEKGLFDGSVVIVQPIAKGLTDTINAQKGEYNLYLRGIQDGKEVCEHTKIQSVSRAINPYEDFDAYLSLAGDPNFRFIISNTTEAGIAYDDSCEITDAPPSSFPAKLTVLLNERFKKGLKGFIILSCELIDHNGDELKKCVLKYADKWNLGEDFKKWLVEENSFCNTLVDRIVTGYPREEAEKLCEELGYEDKLLDTAEIFHLWVIEGHFEDELPLQKAGFNVVWTDDVTPYKKRKVRILNGGHTSMVTGALLSGLETVGQCVNDEVVGNFLKKCLFTEIVPTLGGSAEDENFANAVLERFANPYIKHMLRSIALNSVSKFSVRVLPTILEYKEQQGEYPLSLTMALAALIEFYKTDKPQDLPEVEEFMKKASVEEILKNKELWGSDISDMKKEVEICLNKIHTLGMKRAMEWTI